MWTLIGIAVVVLVGFAIFVLQQDAAERRHEAREARPAVSRAPVVARFTRV
jgi:hypothetical protein